MKIKEIELRKVVGIASQQTSNPSKPINPTQPHPPYQMALVPLLRIQKQLDTRLKNLEKATYNNDDEDFLFCLKHLLSDRIISWIYIGKKSIKFTNFNGFQDKKNVC